MATDSGPYSLMVAGGGSLIAAASSLALSWRGRAKWEPDEQDVPRGAQKVGVLLTAIGVGILWSQYHDLHGAKGSSLLGVTLITAAGTVVGLLVYGVLVGALTYDILKPKRRKIIGGFALTPYAKKLLYDVESTAKAETVQHVLAEAPRHGARGGRVVHHA